ncbi:MAG TPA: serine/threonine-protein kinase [Pirellulales bacterium]|nr:serine/threonine-protein kinase [Pirellulales bacterium]
MNLRATQPLESPPAPAATGSGARFSYASGDRPLDGYTIKRGIGRGGFGEVYYALSDGGKEVALKLVCRNLEVELRGVTQCLNIKHPNLLSLYDIRQDDHDESWVVMEYVAGDSLEGVIQQHPDGLPIDDVMFWMQGIAAGVGYLHHHGIIHRDLKPGNIFCDEGVVKVGDYGLSKFISCSRRSGQTGSVGTVHYMAPEVANGRYGKEIDIYALGIMLYEMITGRVPFEGESLGEVLMKHLTAQPDLTQIADPYRTAIARGLAKDPDARPHTVGEFMSLLPRPLHATLASLGPVPLPPPLARDRLQPPLRPPLGPGMPNGHVPAQPMDGARGATGVWPPMAQAVVEIPQAQAGGGSAPHVVPGASPATVAVAAAVAARVEEPIAQFVRGVWANMHGWWRGANLPTWQRVMLLLAALYVLLHTAVLWIPMLVGGLGLYLIYRVGWTIAHVGQRHRPVQAGAGGMRSPPVMQAGAAGPRPNPARYESPTWRRWRQESLPPPPLLPGLRERTADLIGSMLLATAVVFVVALVVVLYRMSGPHGAVELNQYAWLALTAIIAAWSILIPAKLWERRPVDAALRRFVMLVVGLGLGFAAYLLHAALLVQLHYDYSFKTAAAHLPQSFYGVDGAPSVFAFLAYFGLLWLVPRWWRLADPRRQSRLSIWSVIVSLFWAGAVNCIAPFPQPWGLMFAATVSIAVQMAGAWQPKKIPV